MIACVKHSPGDRVSMINSDDAVEGTINSVLIDRASVSFEVEWWIGKERNHANFFESEIEAVYPENNLLLVSEKIKTDGGVV